ncbi:TetR/AcrR family transcriptional regulator [Cryobacterium frigoriphilum]|uniref:TetR/AcrR family transcriptional regulator n=1 Tax=Cryobacterium frigoriphilum TaxID=1259150 RepID=A0A4R8ZUF6_9MICO|nr:TetR/AcrR family transcriptional regulator [Cryobacterium frigoriphilum]TFD45945.1 TetR/AcrR family transcriptional regulator [Cryobacterium frigoriphilum]
MAVLEPTQPAPRQRRGSARERLLQAAARRFYANGIAATGIDTITADAGVAKMSLYNNFDSKADLVDAYIQARHDEWLALYADRARAASGGRALIGAVFDAYLDHAELAYENGFRGCGLLNAAAELPVGHSGRMLVRGHKDEVEGIVRTHVADLLASAGTTNDDRVDALTLHLALLLEGSMALAGLAGESRKIRAAKMLALELIDAL